MFGSGAASGVGNFLNAFEDENKKSLISDIRNYFTKSYRGGASMIQGIGNQTNQILQ